MWILEEGSHQRYIKDSGNQGGNYHLDEGQGVSITIRVNKKNLRGDKIVMKNTRQIK